MTQKERLPYLIKYLISRKGRLYRIGEKEKALRDNVRKVFSGEVFLPPADFFLFY